MRLAVRVCIALTMLVGTASAQGPAVLILSPKAGDFVSGPIVLRARIEPASRRPSRLTFFADGKVVCTLERPPFECPWDAGAAVAEHHVRVVATFEDGSRAVGSVRTRDAGYVEAVDVDVVQVPVVVTHSGRFVEGLERGDFVLLQDGVPQRLTYFASQASPLEVTVAIDVSGSMSEAMETVKAAVRRFVAALRPEDALTLLGFNDMIFTLARNATAPEERLAAIDELTAWGGTALYDAAIKAIDMFGRRPGRKALVMFTDGEDRVSRMTVDDAREKLEASNVMFYAIAQGRAVTMADLRSALEQFAASSGGAAFFERDEKKLDRVFGEIVDELSHHYMLGYVPPENARKGEWHRIEVRLKGEAAGRHYRVRAREGYRQSRAAAGNGEWDRDEPRFPPARRN